MKYSNRFNEDFEFYLKNIRFAYLENGLVCQFHGKGIPEVQKGENDVKKAFYEFDTHGKLIPCENPALLIELIITKRMINWQIKQWAEGFRDFGEPYSYYLKELTDPPQWVMLSLLNQVRKNEIF